MSRTSLLERNLQINHSWSGFLIFKYGLILLQAKPRKFWFSVLGSNIFSSLHRKLSKVYYSAALLPHHVMTYIADAANKDTPSYWTLRCISDEMLGTQKLLAEFCTFLYFHSCGVLKDSRLAILKKNHRKKERFTMISQ